MTASYAGQRHRSLTEQFTRVFGHAPSATELAQYQRARARLRAHLPARLRRRTARLITRF